MTNNKFEKTLIMPLVVALRPHGLSLPGTIPLVQQQQAIAGAVRWVTPEWDKTEYEKMQRTVDSIVTSNPGIELEKLVMKMAEAIRGVIPNRNFNLTLGSFGVDYKAKKKEAIK